MGHRCKRHHPLVWIVTTTFSCFPDETFETNKKTTVFLLCLFSLRLYTFLGVSIVADVFMASIEVITAQEITVSNDFGEGTSKKSGKSLKLEADEFVSCFCFSI